MWWGKSAQQIVARDRSSCVFIKGMLSAKLVKIELGLLAELGYHQVGVCTPAKPSLGRAIERRVNSSVRPGRRVLEGVGKVARTGEGLGKEQGPPKDDGGSG